jgi:hypothetical protein
VHVGDAAAFIVDFLRTPRPDDGYATYGYEIYLPKVIAAYVREIESVTLPSLDPYRSPRVAELSPDFYEAAWDLCRRGILRPGIRRTGAQATPDGASGNGYCLTTFGRTWIEQGASAVFLARTRMLPARRFPRLRNLCSRPCAAARLDLNNFQ